MKLPKIVADWLSWPRFLNGAQDIWFWAVIAATALGLELGALFYQHVLDILPCELCIYVRVWLVGLFFVSLLAMYFKRWLFTRILSLVAAFVLSIGLANETWNLFVVEYGIGNGGACSFFANFPSWAPLDKWMPFMFEVQELCQATPEIIFGITMTHSLILVCAFLITLISIATLGALISLFAKK